MATRSSHSDKSSRAFGPLNFPTVEPATFKSQFVGLDNEPLEMQCLLCQECYVLPTNQQEMLTHLFKQHRLVIGDVEKISSLKSYVYYWRVKFRETPFAQYCTTLLMDCTPDGQPSKDEAYYLLSDCTTEDKILRSEIQRAKLEWVLAEQVKERTDTNFKRGCMFCRTEFSGSRNAYLQHLSKKHNLHLGHPENLVFVDRLLDLIQSCVEKLICIYCENVFKDRRSLKEHMRKKLHKRVNPKNKDYDKFYMINYLEPGRNWQKLQDEIDDSEDPTGFSSDSEGADDAWSDWNGDSVEVVCLFCTHHHAEFAVILNHMIAEHAFNFEESTKDCDFYQRVKIVNYVRRQLHIEKKCVFCDQPFVDVGEHMRSEKHCKLPARRVWDQPEFYFPTYENDSFLCNLEVTGDDEDSDVASLAGEISNM